MSIPEFHYEGKLTQAGKDPFPLKVDPIPAAIKPPKAPETYADILNVSIELQKVEAPTYSGSREENSSSNTVFRPLVPTTKVVYDSREQTSLCYSEEPSTSDETTMKDKMREQEISRDVPERCMTPKGVDIYKGGRMEESGVPLFSHSFRNSAAQVF